MRVRHVLSVELATSAAGPGAGVGAFSRSARTYAAPESGGMAYRALLTTLAALALAVTAVAPALAADATVNIPSPAVSFTPNTVTVGPNDTVTWVWTRPANERNHSPASDLRGAPESWDADPQIVPFSTKPDFDHGAGHTFAKTFVDAKAASYVYHCRVHADMVGTVIVGGAPTPAFTAAP